MRKFPFFLIFAVLLCACGSPSDTVTVLRELARAAGIPEGHANYPDEIYDAVLRVEDGIIAGKLTPPATREAYEAFLRENM